LGIFLTIFLLALAGGVFWFYKNQNIRLELKNVQNEESNNKNTDLAEEQDNYEEEILVDGMRLKVYRKDTSQSEFIESKVIITEDAEVTDSSRKEITNN